MKTEISFNLQDLSDMFAQADKAIETVRLICKHNLFNDTLDKRDNAKKDDFLALDNERACEGTREQQGTLSYIAARLELGHHCAEALSYKAYLLKDRWELPDPDTNNPQQVREVCEMDSALVNAKSFSDYTR